MALTARALLFIGVALSVLSPRSSDAECAFDFAADLSIQVLNEDTQIPVDDYLNNWNGSIWIREDKLVDVELWRFRVDLRFRNVDKHRFDVAVILQERTNISDTTTIPGIHDSDPIYKQINSSALEYDGKFGTPLVIRPNIGNVILDLTLYPYLEET